jgi:hypothetical protein
VAYGARLESVLGASPRGFESPILRSVMSHVMRKRPPHASMCIPAGRTHLPYYIRHMCVATCVTTEPWATNPGLFLLRQRRSAGWGSRNSEQLAKNVRF